MRYSLRLAATFGLLFFFLALQASTLRADTSSAAPPDQLGKVNFPTSCTAQVQPTIEKGVALLHSFQYTESEKTFADPVPRHPQSPLPPTAKASPPLHQLRTSP